MNLVTRAVGCFTAGLLFALAGSGVTNAQTAVTAEFVGTTPSGPLPRGFIGAVITNAPYEKIVWQLTLLTHPDTRQPTACKLVATCGLQAQSAAGFADGGKTVEIQGTWQILKGTKSNPEAVVYRIKTDNPERSLSFVKVSDHVLHLLDRDRNLMIGDEFWSYTLNRKGIGRNN